MALAPTAHGIRPDSTPDERPRPPLARTLRDALISGQTSGLVMGAVLMATYMLVLGRGPWVPVQIIGAYARGGPVSEGMDAGAFVTGLAMHQLGPSLAWGLVFGALVAVIHPRRALHLALIGLAVGVLAQIVDVSILLPRISTRLGVPNYWAEVHPAVSWAVHVVFGLGLSLFPWKFDPTSRRFS